MKNEEYKHPPLPEGMPDPDEGKDPFYIMNRNRLLKQMRNTNWEDENENQVKKTVKKTNKKIEKQKLENNIKSVKDKFFNFNK